MPPSVQVAVSFPNLFVENGQTILPTYISHLYGTPTGPSVTTVALSNTGPAATFTVSVQLPNYGSAASTTVALAAAENKTVTISPLIDFNQLFANTTNLPAAIGVSVAVGSSQLYGQTFPIQLTGRNTVFWSRNGTPVPHLVSTMVTPQDTGLAIQNLLRAAANRFAGGTSLVGYQPATYPSTSFSIASGATHAELTYVMQGDDVAVTVTSVAGGVDQNLGAYIMDDFNYGEWTAGRQASACAASNATPSTGIALRCTTPPAGWYWIVFANPSSNFASRTVTRTRPMTKWDVTFEQARAIFTELRARGLVYINLPGSGFFGQAQSVRYPAETLSTSSANCIDGALLFSSAFEALGMEPVLAVSFTGGHALMGVRCWAGSPTCIIPIETTAVGSTSISFWDAYVDGLSTWSDWTQDNSLIEIDIKQARAAGLTPAPR